GTWHHVALTFDKNAGGAARLYVDGALKASFTANFTPATKGDFYIGSYPGSAYFKGQLDEVSLYTRALSAGEIYSIFAAGGCGKTPKAINRPPAVYAGADTSIPAGRSLSLHGTVVDDGLPGTASLHAEWTLLSGPGEVTFGSANAPETTATFSAPGIYHLRLIGTDGELSASDDMQVVVGPTPNLPPTVSITAPTNQSEYALGSPISFAVSAMDSDGTVQHVQLYRGNTLVGNAVLNGSVYTFSSNAIPLGTHQFSARAQDDDGTTATSEAITITIRPLGNQAPVVSLGSDRTVNLGESVTIVPAIDDDYLPHGYVIVDWDVVSAPGGIQLTQQEGDSISATFGRTGNYVLRLRVDDTVLSSEDEITITVVAGNRPVPLVQLSSPADGATLAVGQPVTLQATASQPAGSIERVDFYVDGVKIAESGAPYQASWVPAIGQHTLTAVAIDNVGLAGSSQPVQVTAASLPTISWVAPGNNALIQSSMVLSLQVAASDLGSGIAKVEFFEGATKLGEVASAPYNFSAGTRTAGVYSFTAVAHTNSGATATTDVRQVRVAAPVDPNHQNRLAIVSPTESDSITAPTMIKGIIDLQNGYRWSLQYRELGSECDEWVTFGEGSINGVMENVDLASLDTTLLVNGLYAVRLLATDVIGRTFSTPDVNLVVHGDMKIGEFTTSVNDLSIQLPGLSIDVTRTYSSAKRCAGDFGPGWNLDMNAVRLFKNYKLGENWIYDVFIPINFMEPPAYTLADDGPHIVAIAFPSGEVHRFRPILTMTRGNGASFKDPYGNIIGQTFVPIYYGDRLGITYQPLQGSEGCKLIPRGYRAVNPWTYGQQIVPANHEFYISEPSQGQLILCTHENSAQDAPQLIDAVGFDLEMPDGRVFSFGEDGKLTRLTDRNSNWVEVRPNGVFHSSGKSVQWTRNAEGQITGFQDFRGGKVEYFYNTDGELTGVKNRAGALTSYEYEPDSRKLKRILDPSGIPQLGNEYDPSGRLVLQKSAFDSALTRMVHEFTTQKEKVIDPLGNITTLTYDQKGQITAVDDALGNRTSYGYDESGRRIHVVNPLGHAQRFAYEN
ncbi:MAG: hypothetical protein EOP84_07665, partial [Verrucomicrobiaceae bacterium]